MDSSYMGEKERRQRRCEGNNRINFVSNTAPHFPNHCNTLLRDVADFIIKFMAHAANNRAH